MLSVDYDLNMLTPLGLPWDNSRNRDVGCLIIWTEWQSLRFKALPVCDIYIIHFFFYNISCNGYTIVGTTNQVCTQNKEGAKIANARNILTLKMIHKWTVSTVSKQIHYPKNSKLILGEENRKNSMQIEMECMSMQLSCEYYHKRMVYLDINRGCVWSWALTQVLGAAYIRSSRDGSKS